MPEFPLNDDGALNIKSLMKLFKYYPLDIQLIWLAELLVCIAYNKEYPNVDKCKLIKLNTKKTAYVITQDGAKIILLDYCDPVYLDILFNFRNNFVHLGSASAVENLKTLRCNINEVNKLAKFAGVVLNWNCCLQDILVPEKYITGEINNG